MIKTLQNIIEQQQVIIPCTDGAMLAEPHDINPDTGMVEGMYLHPVIAWKIHDLNDGQSPFAEPITTNYDSGGVGAIYYPPGGAWYCLDQERGLGADELLAHFTARLTRFRLKDDELLNIEMSVVEKINAYYQKHKKPMTKTRLKRACFAYRCLSVENVERIEHSIINKHQIDVIFRNRGCSFKPVSR